MPNDSYRRLPYIDTDSIYSPCGSIFHRNSLPDTYSATHPTTRTIQQKLLLLPSPWQNVQSPRARVPYLLRGGLFLPNWSIRHSMFRTSPLVRSPHIPIGISSLYSHLEPTPLLSHGLRLDSNHALCYFCNCPTTQPLAPTNRCITLQRFLDRCHILPPRSLLHNTHNDHGALCIPSYDIAL